MKMFFRLEFLVFLFCLACGAANVTLAHAQQHNDKEVKEDIARHRAMAAAHEAAAKCLESGKTGELCEKELQASCKSLAVGKYCGMKHVH